MFRVQGFRGPSVWWFPGFMVLHSARFRFNGLFGGCGAQGCRRSGPGDMLYCLRAESVV